MVWPKNGFYLLAVCTHCNDSYDTDGQAAYLLWSLCEPGHVGSAVLLHALDLGPTPLSEEAKTAFATQVPDAMAPIATSWWRRCEPLPESSRDLPLADRILEMVLTENPYPDGEKPVIVLNPHYMFDNVNCVEESVKKLLLESEYALNIGRVVQRTLAAGGLRYEALL
jgi:hypothetical protein